ncbi:MAG: hypothetical protein LC639_02965 [Idiomarina sp.]|nr:hypothetical protein [Idiomarina sp.]
MQSQSIQFQTVAIIGASGYVGAELTRLVQQHPALSLSGCYVSEHSSDAGSLLSGLYPQHAHCLKIPLQGLSDSEKSGIKHRADTVFLCTDHSVSVALAPEFLDAGLKVIDLSGGFRLEKAEDYSSFYGFEHQQHQWLQQAVYGLAEWYPEEIAAAQLVAVPGCYPMVQQPFVDIGWHRQGNQLIVMSAIDNLLKGAASQAIQCINLQLGLPLEEGLL